MSDNSPLLTPIEIANELKVSRQAVANWFKEGKFPNAFKVGRAIRIPRSDVEALKLRPKEAM
jgi:excisionase family DNA binding protein